MLSHLWSEFHLGKDLDSTSLCKALNNTLRIKLEAARNRLLLMRLQMNDSFYCFPTHLGHFHDLLSLFKSFKNLVSVFRLIHVKAQQFFIRLEPDSQFPSSVILLLPKAICKLLFEPVPRFGL